MERIKQPCFVSENEAHAAQCAQLIKDISTLTGKDLTMWRKAVSVCAQHDCLTALQSILDEAKALCDPNKTRNPLNNPGGWVTNQLKELGARKGFQWPLAARKGFEPPPLRGKP